MNTTYEYGSCIWLWWRQGKRIVTYVHNLNWNPSTHRCGQQWIDDMDCVVWCVSLCVCANISLTGKNSQWFNSVVRDFRFVHECTEGVPWRIKVYIIWNYAEFYFFSSMFPAIYWLVWTWEQTVIAVVYLWYKAAISKLPFFLSWEFDKKIA